MKQKEFEERLKVLRWCWKMRRYLDGQDMDALKYHAQRLAEAKAKAKEERRADVDC